MNTNNENFMKRISESVKKLVKPPLPLSKIELKKRQQQEQQKLAALERELNELRHQAQQAALRLYLIQHGEAHISNALYYNLFSAIEGDKK